MPRVTQSVDVAFRYSVAQASRELGLTAVALSRRLRAKRIEPVEGTYSLRQLVDCMSEGDSASDRNAAARAELAADKSRLVRLEIRAREGAVIPREETLGFLRGLFANLYRSIRLAELNEEIADRLENEIYAMATAYWIDHGWKLEPESSFGSNGEAPPSRQQIFASRLCALSYYAHEAGCD